MVSAKKFNGILDKDSSLYDVQEMCHIGSKNCRFVLGPNGAQVQNIKGNYVIANSNLPPGNNECIGSFFDPVNQQIIWFNWNQYGANGIYSLSIQTGTISQIFRCFVNSATDILNFDLDYPIASAAIVYRTAGDGNLLYWTDGTNRPMYLNIDTVAANSPFTADMINAAKNAPGTPPTSFYRDDATINSNSLKKKLFRFSYRWIYKNFEKSTFSPISEVPLPVDDDNPAIANDPTKNNFIRLTLYTGGSDFQAVELAVQESLGTTWSDFKNVSIFDRDDYNLTVNSSFTFDFYNNGGYNPIAPEETDLYFDWLPNKANTLELLNGNVIVYGGITDGANGLQRSDVDVVLTATSIFQPSDYGFAYKWSGTYRFGLQYFDDRNKPIGGVVSFVADAVDTTDFSVTMPAASLTGATSTIPYVNAVINHLPPAGATKYQWVRTENQVTRKFLYYCTNDLQSDANFLYFCIQNLIEQKEENTGFVPSYEFSPGDRVRAVAQYDLFTGLTTLSPQLDFEILGTVERTMTSPASTGTFVKVNKPAVLPYTNFVIIELYTPSVNTQENQLIFYEFGEKYDIYESGGVRYHRGGIQDQTGSQPAITAFTDGDVYYRLRDFGRLVIFGGNFTATIMDANYSDYFSSAVNSNGRVWLIDENIREEYNPVLVRWGGKYQAGTNLNALNRFRPNDYDEVDRSKGDIRKFKVRDRILRVAQDRGIGQYGIYARFIQNNDGTGELVTTNEIITSNNIQYYQGTYGVCGYPTNFISTTNADYFLDVVTGRAIRLAGDGLTDLGLLYKGQYFFPDWVVPYNQEVTRSNGAVGKVMGFFDNFDNDCHFILQPGSTDTLDLPGRHFSFNEMRNGFCCDELSYQPDWAISVNGITYSWYEGRLYKHDVNGNNYCNFYGVQHDAEITVVFNPNPGQKKSWNSIAEVANSIWSAPLIYTDTESYPGQRQESNLVAAEFTVLEGQPTTSFKRSIHSRGEKINGDFLKGSYCVVKLRKENASNLVTLSQLTVRFTDSPLNVQ